MFTGGPANGAALFLRENTRLPVDSVSDSNQIVYKAVAEELARQVFHKSSVTSHQA